MDSVEKRVGRRDGERKDDNDDDDDDEKETDPERARNLKLLLGGLFNSLAGILGNKRFGFAEYQTRGEGNNGIRYMDLQKRQKKRPDWLAVGGGASVEFLEKKKEG